MSDSSSHGIFLSYRREDATPYARLLKSELTGRFPDAPVFMDLDSIDPGLDFVEVIERAVDSCAVLVVLIGRQWATLADEEGQRRLDDPDDFVRSEVQTALERGVRVIPVLVDGARPVRRQDLPDELQKLARLNALELSAGRYQFDADRLFNAIQQVLAAVNEQEEAERKAAEETEEAKRKAQEEAARKAREEEAARKAREEEAARKAREEEAARKAREEEAARKAREEEAARKAREEAELSVQEKQAQVAGQSGDPIGARDRFRELLSIRERVSGPEHPETLADRAALANWTGYAGDPASARDQWAALAPVFERIFGTDDPRTVQARISRARWWSRLKPKPLP